MNMTNDTNSYDILTDIIAGTHNTQDDRACTDLFNVHSMGERYKKFHGHIALVVCIFGTVANLLNVIVLTRKEMSTPINRMLTALAVADMLVMVEYIPFALHNYVLSRPDEAIYSYSWAVFVLFHSNFSQIFHTISIQLTLTMAVWRYVAIKGSNRSASYCTFKNCNLCILFSYVLPIFLCIPLYLTFAINEQVEVKYIPPIQFKDQSIKSVVDIFCVKYSPLSCTKQEVLKYYVGLSKLAESRDGLLKGINFWTYSVVFKLIPCVVLTFFMCWLVNVLREWSPGQTLYKARKHHKMLEGKSTGYQMTTINNEGHSVNPDGKSMMMMMEDGHQNQQQQQQQTQLQQPNNSSLPRRIGSKGSGRHVKIVENDDDNASHRNTPDNKSLLSHNNHHPLSRGSSGGGGGGSIDHDHDNKGSSPTTVTGPLLGVSMMTASVAAMDSRRASEVSTCYPPDTPPPHLDYNNGRAGSFPNDSNREGGGGEHNPASRRSKGFIRFPSIRRSSTQQGDGKNGKGGKNSRRTDRTSKMLIAVLVLFLATEFPQGIMALLTGIYGQHFLQHCYNSWAEVWDTLALLNSAINFLLYCFMSKQFRLQFRLIFRLNRYCKRPKWINITTCNHNATISTTV